MKTTTRFQVFPPLRKNTRGVQAGFVLFAFSLALVLILGSAGLAIDLGRMYVTRSESQAYCDSAAIAAALKLDGTVGGITRARAAALAVPKGWQFGTTVFDPTRTVVEFAQTLAGPYAANPSPAKDYVCARVTTRVTLPLYLLPVTVGSPSSTIAASAVAKQMVLSGPGVGHYSPFSPFGAPVMSPLGPTSGEGSPEPMYWDDPFNMKHAEITDGTTTTYQHGGSYNIFWPNDSNLQHNWTDSNYVCTDSQYPSLLSLTTAPSLSNSNRGYIYNAANVVDATIIAGVLPAGYPPITTGMNIAPDFLAVSSGVMENNLTNGLQSKVLTDTDSTSVWYQDYVQNNQGNGARIVLMPVNSGDCDHNPLTFLVDHGSHKTSYSGNNTCTFPVGDGTTNTSPAVPSYTVIGWGRFFLREAGYYGHIVGNEGVCAEYIGPGLVEGGGKPAGSNIYAVKLIQ